MTKPPDFYDVEQLAYSFYVSRGRQEGQALSHWLEAETHLSEYNCYCEAEAGTLGYSAGTLSTGDPSS
jgi:hypothetical protein